MSTETTRPLPLGALLINAGAFAVPAALGYLFAAVIKAINPSDVDVSADLAYLRPILIVAAVLVVIAVATAVLSNLALTRRRHPAAPALWAVLGVQVAAVVVILVAQLWEKAVTGV